MTKVSSLLSLFGLMFVGLVAEAQPRLDAVHLLLDGSLSDAEVADRDHVFNSLQEVVKHLSDTTTVYVRPWVYWVDDPDRPAVRVGEHGREPFGMVVRTTKLTLVGLGDDARDVVLASMRGQTQGAVGNFTMFDFHVDELTVENMTLGNFCNVDLDYPLHPELSRAKRSATITQAHVGYVHGRRLEARRVRFVSRLNLNPLNGAQESLYDSCHFECTDDALNGGNAVYRHCHFDLYGQKPWWSTFGAGPLLVDCDFHVKGDNREMYFCKQGGPLTLVNCRYHAPSTLGYIGWAPYPQPWLRCYQQDFTLNGRPYQIGIRQPQNTVVLRDAASIIAHGTPFLDISRHEAALRTGEDSLVLVCSGSAAVEWRTTSYGHPVALTPLGRDSVLVVPTNQGGRTDSCCVVATTPDGREAACHVTVHPRQLPAPAFLRQPRLLLQKGVALLSYDLDLQDRSDESVVTWLRDGIPVSVVSADPMALGYPAYRLTDADNGHLLSATITPKLHGSLAGAAIRVDAPQVIKGLKGQKQLETNFSDLPCQWQPRVLPGYWTVDGHKPADTEAFPWAFDARRPMWEYGEGFNGTVGKGLLQAQRGARLMYSPPVEKDYGDMSLVLLVDPTKTAGQGFGSATGQYMDVCLKFDPLTLSGYGLRIERTVKHSKAVDFLLVEYDHGVVRPLTAPLSATCYRTGCTIELSCRGHRLSAQVATTTPRPAGSDLAHEVSLQAEVTGNAFGGIHIQHTGTCGESTTMLHRLQVRWR